MISEPVTQRRHCCHIERRFWTKSDSLGKSIALPPAFPAGTARVPGDDKMWHQRCNELVELKRKKGHRIVPEPREQDKSPGWWVNDQRTCHTKNKMPQDRKELLDALGFVWKAGSLAARLSDRDKKWSQHRVKLIKFQQKSGNCVVPKWCDEDKAFGRWVSAQRVLLANNQTREDRKVLLDALKFVGSV